MANQHRDTESSDERFKRALRAEIDVQSESTGYSLVLSITGDTFDDKLVWRVRDRLRELTVSGIAAHSDIVDRGPEGMAAIAARIVVDKFIQQDKRFEEGWVATKTSWVDTDDVTHFGVDYAWERPNGTCRGMTHEDQTILKGFKDGRYEKAHAEAMLNGSYRHERPPPPPLLPGYNPQREAFYADREDFALF